MLSFYIKHCGVFFLGLWIPVGDWDVSPVPWRGEDELEGEEGMEKPVLFGKIDLTLGTRVYCERG